MHRIAPTRVYPHLPLWIVTILLAMAVLAACAAPADTDKDAFTAPPPAAESVTAEPVQDAATDGAKEAPSLAAKVAAGELPPLEDLIYKQCCFATRLAN